MISFTETLAALAITMTVSTTGLIAYTDTVDTANSLNNTAVEKLAVNTLNEYNYQLMDNGFLEDTQFEKYGFIVSITETNECGAEVTLTNKKGDYSTTVNYCTKKDFTNKLIFQKV